MDPLSILGAAVGVTSLILQVADECIRGYKIYQTAANLPEAYRYLHLRIHLEEQRFRNFALEAGILHEDGILCSTLHVNRAILLATLAEIKGLLEQFAARNGKYRELDAKDNVDWTDSSEAGPELGTLLNSQPLQPTTTRSVKGVHKFAKHMLQTGKNLRTIVSEPRRLTWATFDKDAFEDLISKLENLNSFLVSLLDSSQTRKLQETMNTTYLEILRLRNDVFSLKILVGALAPSSPPEEFRAQSDDKSPNVDLLTHAVSEEKSAQEKRKAYMQTLAEIKIRNTSLSSSNGEATVSNSPGSVIETRLDLDKFHFSRLDDNIEVPAPRIDATYLGRDVWIEWSILPGELAEDRIALLTDFIRFAKPDGFRAPVCLGYVKQIQDDDDGFRFGVVFEKPATAMADSKVTTLRDSLSRLPAPSLSRRMSLCALLARCIHSLHAVDWLHKAFRSDNIVFCSDPPDLNAPFVTGFEFSRPNAFDTFSEKPSYDPSKDIYRHPRAQSSQSGGTYRTSYDLYGLGILIIEIMEWKPIERLVGLKDLSEATPLMLLDVQSVLLGELSTNSKLKPPKEILSQVSSACGDAVCAVIESCLRADEVERREYPKQPEVEVALTLQSTMEQDVVKKLDRIAEVL